MDSHSIFGLTISTDFPLDELPPSTDATDVDICSRLLPAKTNWGDDEWDVGGTPQDRTFFWIEAGVFNIRNGTTIRYDSGTRDKRVIRDALFGECMAVAMTQRGDFVLHGSVATRSDKAVIFAGESGFGKSSLVTCLMQDGWEGMSDDLAVIRHHEDGPLVFPGYPQFNLCPDALSALNLPADLEVAYQDSLKKAWAPEIAQTPSNVANVFILEEGERREVTPLKGTLAVLALLENTFAAHLARSYGTPFLDQETERIYLSTAAALVESCAIHKLSIPKGDFVPEECLAALADYLP